MMDTAVLTDRLEKTHDLSDDELSALLQCDDAEYLYERARAVCDRVYGNNVYLRGLVEISSFCKNNCHYCGIRRDNHNADRYRLDADTILRCCETGYALGIRTFVLQGGEDPWFTDERLCAIISAIKERFPDCAVTLSIGERERESYMRLHEAGTDRYLLRHETADKAHYELLHPKEMSYDHRMQCLTDLRDTGFQVGCGMMVGSPYQKLSHLICDLRFIQRFRPEMAGIGPFIPHHDTIFADHAAGSAELTLRLIAVIRLMLPETLIPATTALGTVETNGRERGLLAGANVIMPNISPADVRGKYLLYDNKICVSEKTAECIRCIHRRVESVGMKVVTDRGDPAKAQDLE